MSQNTTSPTIFKEDFSLSFLVSQCFEIVLKVILPATILSVAIALILVFITKPKKEYTVDTLKFLLSFTIIGVTVGILSGASRDASVGNLITATTTTVAAVLAYIFSDKIQEGFRKNLPISMIGFTVAILFGAFFGALLRTGMTDK